jgi:hypothetical protein
MYLTLKRHRALFQTAVLLDTAQIRCRRRKRQLWSLTSVKARTWEPVLLSCLVLTKDRVSTTQDVLVPLARYIVSDSAGVTNPANDDFAVVCAKLGVERSALRTAGVSVGFVAVNAIRIFVANAVWLTSWNLRTNTGMTFEMAAAGTTASNWACLLRPLRLLARCKDMVCTAVQRSPWATSSASTPERSLVDLKETGEGPSIT